MKDGFLCRRCSPWSLSHYFIVLLLDMAKKPGLWANIHAKRKRGEAPAKKGDKNYPETLDIGEGMKKARENVGADKCWDGYKAKGTKKKDGKEVPNCVKEGKSFAEFCAEGKSRIETDPEYRKRFKALADNFAQKRKEQTKAKKNKVAEQAGEGTVQIEDADGNPFVEILDVIGPDDLNVTGWKQQMDEAAWTKKAGKSEAGGLNEKGRKSYERENPGSDLKAHSKKVGNKRRASFCARMKGMRKRQKPENNTGDDRLSKSLRAWNC